MPRTKGQPKQAARKSTGSQGPRKPPVTKAVKKRTPATTGGIKKPRSRQTVVMRQVEHYQRTTELVIRRSRLPSQPKPKTVAASKAAKAPAKRVTAKK